MIASKICNQTGISIYFITCATFFFMDDQCFICLGEDDLESHCTCNLKVHKTCLVKFLENVPMTDLKCSVCKSKYSVVPKRHRTQISLNLIMAFFALLVIVQCVSAAYFASSMNDFGSILNVFLLVVLVIFYACMHALYKRETSTYKWIRVFVSVTENEVFTREGFSVCVHAKGGRRFFMNHFDVHVCF